MLSGGVFQNELLLEHTKERLLRSGLRLWTNHAVPPNDGGISLGQAALAACSAASVRLFFQALHVGNERVDIAGRKLVLLFGIGDLLADFTFLAISIGSTIHSRISAAESFDPTPSRGSCLAPSSSMEWHTWHF